MWIGIRLDTCRACLPIFHVALSADTAVRLLFPRRGGRAQVWQQCFSGWFLKHLSQKPLEFLLKVQPCHTIEASQVRISGFAAWESEGFNNVPGSYFMNVKA